MLYSPENIEHLKYLEKIFSDPTKKIFIAWGLIDYIEQIQKEKGLLLNIPIDVI